MENTLPPSALYRSEVDRGSIKQDPAQLSALELLDELRLQILSREQHENRASNWLKALQSILGSGNPEKIRGLYLWGGVGTGKTLIMDLFFASLPKGLATRTHFHRFMHSIHQHKSQIRNQSEPLEIIASGIVSKSRVLCLDEFTVSDITDAMIMSGLLRHLFSKDAVLITTSNTPVDQLYQSGLQRDRFLPAIALLKECTLCLEVDQGSDYRMAFLQKNSVFNVPADSPNYQKLKVAFDQLSDRGEKPFSDSGNQKICINGREIEVIDACLGIVWFDFNAICRSNRSNADFIEIAKQFHSVFISAIPELTTIDDDATRRFIELIDELYDRNVNLLVTSDKPPHEIYRGKRLAQPFQRTASRLIEMGAEEYLSRPHLA